MHLFLRAAVCIAPARLACCVQARGPKQVINKVRCGEKTNLGRGKAGSVPFLDGMHWHALRNTNYPWHMRKREVSKPFTAHSYHNSV
jgi:hypothetical protein